MESSVLALMTLRPGSLDRDLMRWIGTGERTRLASVVVAGVTGLGSLLVAAPASALSPLGTITTIAGGFRSGPATSIAQAPVTLAAGPGGTVYVADSHAPGVQEIEPDGNEHVVGKLFLALAVGGGGDVAGTITINNVVQTVAASDCAVGMCPFGYADAMTKGDTYTVAGTGAAGPAGDLGPAVNAKLDTPEAVAVAPNGDLVIADTGSAEIRVVAAADCAAGSCGFGSSSAMTRGYIYDIADVEADSVAVDAAGEVLFDNQGPIKVLAAASCLAGTCPYGIDGMTAGQVYTINSAVEGLGASAALAVDASGDVAVAGADGREYGISRLGCAAACPFGVAGPMTAGTAYPIAGDPSASTQVADGTPATSGVLGGVQGVAVDSGGDLLVASVTGADIRLVAPSDCAASCPFGLAATTKGDIYTIAGSPTSYNGDGGLATNAQLVSPVGVATDSRGDVLVSEGSSVDPAANRVLLVAGADCAVGGCPFGYAGAMTQGHIYTVAGGGTTGFVEGALAGSVLLASAGPIAIDAAGDLAVADVANDEILVVPATSCPTGSCPFGFPDSMTRGHIYLLSGHGPGFSGDGGPAGSALFVLIGGLTVDSAGNLIVADFDEIRLIASSSCQAGACPYGFSGAMTKGDIYAVAGNGTQGFSGDGGPATSAQIDEPSGVAVDAAGDIVITEALNYVARLVAGSSCQAGQCPFGFPGAMTRGDIYTVAGDHNNFFVSGDGGPAIGAGLGIPEGGMTIDPAGDLLLDSTGILVPGGANVVRLVANASCSGNCPFGYAGAMTAGDIYTVAGGVGGVFNGDGIPALTTALSAPHGLAVDGDGSLLIDDAAPNGRVRAVSGPAFAPVTVSAPSASTTYGTIPTLAPKGYSSGLDPVIPATCSTTATMTSPPGTYPVTCSGGFAQGETFTSGTAGTLTVTPAPLTVTASSATIAPGDPIPAVTASYSGFVNGETAASLTTAPTCSTTATSSSSVGTYPTTCSGAVDANYAITYVAGTVRIKAPSSGGGGPPYTPPAVGNPTITAKVTSATPKTHGWYRSPVTVSFTCTAGSAALAATCPGPVTVRHAGAKQNVTERITAIDGGSASVTVTVSIDRTGPHVAVHGVKNGHTYRAGHGPHVTCVARDALSGLAARCRVTSTHHRRGGFRHVHYIASATDVAGNTTRIQGSYRVRRKSST
ncbi:MAG TPA: MBG domain-containing protein [Mycobacteriales bacterium]|nr:MBG domain-containing protein [Mycobacteriales bacterium]